MQHRKKRGPSPIDELIKTFVRDHGLRTGGGYAQVFRAWTESLPAPLQKHAQPVRFRGGELTVEVDSATHMQELKNFTGENYRCQANDRLGKETIRRVGFKLRG